MLLNSKKQLGIEIQDDGIQVVEISASKRRVIVHNSLHIPIEKGLVVDGEILDPVELGQILRQQLDVAEIRTKNIHMVVPSRFVVIRQLSLPKIPKNSQRQVIELEIQNSIHLPFEESVFDFVKFESNESSSKRKQNEQEYKGILEPESEESLDSYVVVIASKQIVDKLIDTAQMASLRVKSIDVRALALHRLFLFGKDESTLDLFNNQSTIYLDIGENNSEIHIFRGNILIFTRTVPLPLSTYRHSTLDMIAATAEEEMSAIPSGIDSDLESLTDYQTFVQNLSYEIERSINFYQFSLNNRDQVISRVVLSGALPHSFQIDQALSKRLDLPVDVIESNSIEMADRLEPTHLQIHHYAIALGLAIREGK